MSTGRVSLDQPEANMYGCLPCPKCGSKTRWPTQDIHPTNPSQVLCDDCEFTEPIESLGTGYQT